MALNGGVTVSILNYTTQIEVERTLMEISRILTQHGATAILTEFDSEGEVAALSFRVRVDDREVAFRLPADWRPILTLLERDQKVPKKSKVKAQAIRVAWRIIKDWTEAQMALIETQMVTMEQVFLPYAIADDGQTVYEHLRAHQLALPANMPLLLGSTMSEVRAPVTPASERCGARREQRRGDGAGCFPQYGLSDLSEPYHQGMSGGISYKHGDTVGEPISTRYSPITALNSPGSCTFNNGICEAQFSALGDSPTVSMGLAYTQFFCRFER
jgi:hypothetical protein